MCDIRRYRTVKVCLPPRMVARFFLSGISQISLAGRILSFLLFSGDAFRNADSQSMGWVWDFEILGFWDFRNFIYEVLFFK